ncbi:MAG: immunoglobulin domain-containing protein, partial [Opitutaceae bacterium]
MSNPRYALLLAVALSAVASLTHAQPIYKGLPAFGVQFEHEYVQSSTAAPRLANPAAIFYAFLLPNNRVGSVRLPSGSTSAIPNGQITSQFATFAAFDAAYPAGTYTLAIGSVTGIALAIPANPFPADIPRVVGGTWNAAGQLVINPAIDTTITINSYAGYGKAGVDTNLSLLVNDNNGDTVIGRDQFSSEAASPFTTFTIPAGTLVAGRSYFVDVSFGIFHATNTTGLSGAVAFSIANNFLEFPLSVVAAANAAPTIAAQPASKMIATGSTVAFSVEADGTPKPTYQWRKDGVAISGATSATLLLAGANALAGAYTCVITNASGSVTSAPATLAVSNVAATDVGRLANLSVLASTGPGAQLLTMGANVGGAGTTGALPLVVRGVGPGLAAYGVGGTLADPTMAIFPEGSGTPSATNDNWGGSVAMAAAFVNVGAFELPPASLDAAALHNQVAGGFTVQVAGKGAATGTVIAEVYDAAGIARTATTPRLVNLSTLTSVPTAGTLTAGFVIGGSTSRTVLVRAVGPTLGTAFSIPGTMADPKLEVFAENGTKLAENDNWAGAPAIAAANAATGAFAFSGNATKDAAVVITLAPGNYSARASGLN